MFKSHTKLSLSQNPMMVFPTDKGLFELDPTVTEKTEYQIAVNSGRDPLSRYGFRSFHGFSQPIVVLYFQAYVPLKAVNMVKQYLLSNSGYKLKKIVSNDCSRDEVRYADENLRIHEIPDDIPSSSELKGDIIQGYLLDIVTRQFTTQQKPI